MVFSLQQPATSDRDQALSRRHNSVIQVFTHKPPSTAQIGEYPGVLKLRDLLRLANTKFYQPQIIIFVRTSLRSQWASILQRLRWKSTLISWSSAAAQPASSQHFWLVVLVSLSA